MIRIAVVTHKEYELPEDPLYLPVWAGAALSPVIPGEYLRDDSGDNISDRNGLYSELTALYWLWKNYDDICPGADAAGICHYRRYFAAGNDKTAGILKASDAERLIKPGEIVLPEARNYVIESNYSQYVHAHHAADLLATRDVIGERHPGYLSSFDKRMALRKGHRFNMFIMPRADLDSYCSWLFDILFELEDRLDTTGYEGRDRRVLGLVSERLLDVWLDANGASYTELPYIMTEREHLALKAIGLAGRKVRAIIKTE